MFQKMKKIIFGVISHGLKDSRETFVVLWMKRPRLRGRAESLWLKTVYIDAAVSRTSVNAAPINALIEMTVVRSDVFQCFGMIMASPRFQYLIGFLILPNFPALTLLPFGLGRLDWLILIALAKHGWVLLICVCVHMYIIYTNHFPCSIISFVT